MQGYAKKILFEVFAFSSSTVLHLYVMAKQFVFKYLIIHKKGIQKMETSYSSQMNWQKLTIL